MKFKYIKYLRLCLLELFYDVWFFIFFFGVCKIDKRGRNVFDVKYYYLK